MQEEWSLNLHVSRPEKDKDFWWCQEKFGWPLLGKVYDRKNTLSTKRQKKVQQSGARIATNCCYYLKEKPSLKTQRDPGVDLVLLDLNLPLEDGYEVLAKLREDSHFANARVVAVTADSDQASMERAKKAGFDGFLGKPIVVSKFPGQITDILQGKSVWDLGR